MRVLITGGQGFLGVALTKELQAQGHWVSSYDLKAGNESGADHIMNGSVLDADKLDFAVNTKKFDTVVHAACLLGVQRTDSNPLETMDVIVQGTRNVVDCCSTYKPRLVYLSSSEVYGNPSLGVRLEEGMDVSPRTPYAAAKLCAEHLVKATTMHACIVRPFNVYGTGQRSAFVVSLMMQNALVGKPIKVYGDGTQVRSFCFIDDFVKALAKIVAGQADGHIVNIGRNEPIPMYLLAELIKKVTGSESQIELVPYERSDRLESREIGFRAPDISWAKTHLDWSPDVTLEEGLKRMVMEMKVGA